MKVIAVYLTVCAAVIVAAIAALDGGMKMYHRYQIAQTYNVQNCDTPVIHLKKANVDVCLNPGISWVDLVLSKPARPEFDDALERIKGVDMDTSRRDDKRELFEVVYYMSRTTDGQFISDLITTMDNPALYN